MKYLEISLGTVMRRDYRDYNKYILKFETNTKLNIEATRHLLRTYP